MGRLWMTIIFFHREPMVTFLSKELSQRGTVRVSLFPLRSHPGDFGSGHLRQGERVGGGVAVRQVSAGIEVAVERGDAGQAVALETVRLDWGLTPLRKGLVARAILGAVEFIVVRQAEREMEIAVVGADGAQPSPGAVKLLVMFRLARSARSSVVDPLQWTPIEF